YLLARRDTSGLSEDLVSLPADERRIALILDLEDFVIDQCEYTAKKTSRSILCWLKSTCPLPSYPKPFTLMRLPSTTVKVSAAI
ncbi:hypothetical protein B0J15DRAFT_401139, partial [Fusarium solani]